MSLQIKIIKKDGTKVPFDPDKIITAITKSADRVLVKLTDQNKQDVLHNVNVQILSNYVELKHPLENKVTIVQMHSYVEKALDKVLPEVAKSYRDYRNYKTDFVAITDKVYKKSQSIQYRGDKENSNTDSALVTTKRSLVYGEFNKELYNKFFLTPEEKQACKDGYIYIHDKSARRDTLNCFSRDTRFITNQGIFSFEDFNDGDKVIVPTHTGDLQQATIRCFGKQTLQQVTFKRGSKGEKTIRCTANHRWILKDGTQTTSLKYKDKLQLTPNISQFDWEESTDEEKKYWSYGFAMGDGHTRQGSKNYWYTQIRLCGNKAKFKDFFEESGFTVTKPDCFNGDFAVYIPHFRKNKFNPLKIGFSYWKAFMWGYLSADGNQNLSYSSNSPFRGVCVTGKNNDWVEHLLNSSGFFVTKKDDLTNKITNFGERTDTTINYAIYSDQGCRGWVVQDILDLGIQEDVWCLEVENDHSFILEYGIVTGNCCLFDAETVMKGGFEMGNLSYSEPNSINTACDVLGDVIMMSASMQYGGWSTRIDNLLSYYCKKSEKIYTEEYIQSVKEYTTINSIVLETAKKYAISKTIRDLEQGAQGLEYKLNSVASSRGDYVFTTFALGLDDSFWGKEVSKAFLRVRRGGQGKEGYKKPVLFPKLVFLYDEELHGKGNKLEDVFEEAVLCSSKCMYPDFLSLSGEGYVPSMYKEHGAIVFPMG